MIKKIIFDFLASLGYISYLYIGNVASVSTAVNDFIKELEKNPSLVSTANTSEI